jgi:hypothetical protein
MYFYRNKNKLVRLLIIILSSITIFLLAHIQYSVVGAEDLLPKKRSLETTIETSFDTFLLTNNTFSPKGNGVIIQKDVYNQKRHASNPNSAIPKYEYHVLSNRHLVPHVKSRYLIRINNDYHQVVAIYPTDIEVPGTPDLALIKFRSDRELEVLSLGYLDQLNSNQTIYIGGRVNSIFMFIKGRIEKISSGKITYTDQTEETPYGMSGSPILNDNGTLVGIHTAVKTGISVDTIRLFLQAQKEQYGTEEKDSKSCHNTSSIRCKTPVVVMPST